jgi:hypothetical protein
MESMPKAADSRAVIARAAHSTGCSGTACLGTSDQGVRGRKPAMPGRFGKRLPTAARGPRPAADRAFMRYVTLLRLLLHAGGGEPPTVEETLRRGPARSPGDTSSACRPGQGGCVASALPRARPEQAPEARPHARRRPVRGEPASWVDLRSCTRTEVEKFEKISRTPVRVGRVGLEPTADGL